MWTLHYTPTSPFARVVRVLARERGLLDHIELVRTHPFEDEGKLHAVNPVGQIPALLVGTQPVFDSRTICAFLDQQGPDAPLAGTELAEQVRLSAAHGLMEAAVALRMERVRPADDQRADTVERLQQRIFRLVGWLRPSGQAEPTLADLYLGCALRYLDFRHPGLLWRSISAQRAEGTRAGNKAQTRPISAVPLARPVRPIAPPNAEWLLGFQRRASMVATQFG